MMKGKNSGKMPEGGEMHLMYMNPASWAGAFISIRKGKLSLVLSAMAQQPCDVDIIFII